MDKKLVVDVKGMHCAACSARIERVVGGMAGVQKANVNLAAETLALEYRESLVEYEAIAEKVQGLGFELNNPDKQNEGKIELSIKGMHCAACSTRIEKVVSDLPGVVTASVNLATEHGTFLYVPKEIGPRAIKEKITSLGFTPMRVSEGSQEFEKKEREKIELLKQSRKRLMYKLILVVPLLIISMGEMMGVPQPSFLSPHVSPLNFALAQLVLAGWIMWLGRHFYTNGIPALIRKAPNMDSLIAVGTGAAFIYSFWNLVEIAAGVSPHEKAMDLYFESAGVLIALVSLGKYLEAKSKYQTSDAIRMLMQLTPKTAVLVQGNEHIEIGADEIEPGDILLVKPGANVPTDGEVATGKASVDESLMTGEAMPVAKAAGDPVYGGTVNTSSTFSMVASQTGENTMLAGIIRMVQEAQGTKPSIARIADRVSYYFVPAVMVFALLTGVCWYLIGDVGFSQSLRFFIAVLVIACPCAMGLATPISVMVGTGRGAQLGILVKNGEILERLEKVKTIIFDKTGTITSGKPEVIEVIPEKEMSKEQLLELIGSAENHSEHPLADAIVRFAEKMAITFKEPESFDVYSGKGIIAQVDGYKVVVGNRDFCRSNVLSVDAIDKSIDGKSAEGKTVLYAAVDGRYAGQLIIADKIKPEAAEVVHQLKESSIEVAMLTGDNRATAAAVAKEAGISRVIAEVLPDSKAQVVEEFQNNGGMVAMVGDGINDAPALARADIGIAMGTGIDIAIESGDVVLMKGDLKGVALAVNLSRAVMKNIRQNLFWAFGYNIMGLPIAAGFLYIFGGPSLNPMFAGAAMALSSVSVVANALRLRFFEK